MKGKAALHETLRRQILTLELEPDQDLDEVKLSEEYGISRTPVRDVLRQLAVEGYVDIRENRGARVVPMNHATLRDFFLVAPMIYEAIGRLAVQNWRASQLEALMTCQQRFRAAITQNDAEKMVVENNRFHELIGEMAGSAFLKPTLNRLLIDHARIGHTFFRPSSEDMAANLAKSCNHHDEMINALAEKNESAMVYLVFEHWELSRRNMEMFIAPKALKSETVDRMLGQSPANAETLI